MHYWGQNLAVSWKTPFIPFWNSGPVSEFFEQFYPRNMTLLVFFHPFKLDIITATLLHWIWWFLWIFASFESSQEEWRWWRCRGLKTGTEKASKRVQTWRWRRCLGHGRPARERRTESWLWRPRPRRQPGRRMCWEADWTGIKERKLKLLSF